MPIETRNGSTTVTGASVETYRALALQSAIKLYLECGMLTVRGLTATRMREYATAYTGVPYKRGKTGMREALEDLRAMTEGMREAGASSDEIGETLAARREAK